MAQTKRNDLEMYETFATDWWNRDSGRFRSLQGISEFRLQALTEWIPGIERKTVVDLGCGGGLLCAPLSHRGCRVIGVDRSPASLRVAEEHSAPSARYIEADIRHVPLPDECADVVILADVLDHLPDYDIALREAVRLLRPHGLVYVNTINRNFLSWLLAIVVGENVGLIPKGTHDFALFIRPAELVDAARKAGLTVKGFQGERPDLARTIRHWAIHFAPTRSLSVAYSAFLEKQ